MDFSQKLPPGLSFYRLLEEILAFELEQVFCPHKSKEIYGLLKQVTEPSWFCKIYVFKDLRRKILYVMKLIWRHKHSDKFRLLENWWTAGKYYSPLFFVLFAIFWERKTVYYRKVYPTTKQLMAYLSSTKKCFMLGMLIYRVLQDKFDPHTVNDSGKYSADQWHRHIIAQEHHLFFLLESDCRDLISIFTYII